jgi:hypothetical protein
MISPAPPIDMRVCLIATHFAEYSFELAQALARAGADVLVVASLENTIGEIGEVFVRGGCGGVRTHFIRKSRNPVNLLGQALGLSGAVRAFRPHVMHVQEDSKDVLAAALPFLPKVPMLLTMHDPKPHSGADAKVRSRSRHGAYIVQLRRRADAHSRARAVPWWIGRPRMRWRGVAVNVHVIPHGAARRASCSDDASRPSNLPAVFSSVVSKPTRGCAISLRWFAQAQCPGGSCHRVSLRDAVVISSVTGPICRTRPDVRVDREIPDTRGSGARVFSKRCCRCDAL